MAAGGLVNPSPSDTIKILDSKAKPKTFAKQVRNADYIVLDVSQFNCNLEEAELVIKTLKYADGEPSDKDQVLVVVSSPMSWSKTPVRASGPYTEADRESRIPLPKYLPLKQIEQSALALQKLANSRLRVHVICAGFMYGNGEQNDIFYEFFRRAWVSLHPQLAALPIVGKGDNVMPTIHVADLTRIVDTIFLSSSGHCVDTSLNFDSYLIAVDESSQKGKTQADIMKAISEGIGSGATKELAITDCLTESWCEFLQVDVAFKQNDCIKNLFAWKCASGINQSSMKMLNEEFNFFRGLFPLKIFLTGPPAAGKTHFAEKLSAQYGVPHITIQSVINMGLQL